MTRVAEEYISTSCHRTECWNCGEWYKNASKSCPRCKTLNDDHLTARVVHTERIYKTKEKKVVDKICPQCKKTFSVSGPQKKKYCSKTCSDASQRTGFDTKAYMKAYYLKRKLEKQQRANPNPPKIGIVPAQQSQPE